MAEGKKGKAEVNGARSFRFAPSILDQLRLEAARRNMSQTALIASLIEELGSGTAAAKADVRIANAAATACIAALDLVRAMDPERAGIELAASKLEDLIEVLLAGSGS